MSIYFYLSIYIYHSGRADWMARILLGEAAVLLNTIIDLTNISSPITIHTVKTFRSERIRLIYSVELEKYPQAFEVLLHNYELRKKLINYDYLFDKLDQILLRCAKNPKINCKNEINKLMKSDLGKVVNDGAYQIYDN